ncbi:MAG: AmmeMemoRadiSam system protein B [Candidatus Eisenbacteria bacterium]|uniref:AmmeMemoRadiSam system protein B n=1 Tax=Eiseniibacteriota bacterium TaxID=2212470 RepID=A0A956LYR9_UNCEI|nr:AmmeMemoRadiSam system protein B [Candidatus Eisenbacteria bacterium]
MAIPSTPALRGQRDGIGFATHAADMAAVWDASAKDPRPLSLSALPVTPVVGAICPHDDYLYAGRVYREILPALTARTVIVVGVFHAYARSGFRDRIVFDSHAHWRTPDGEIPVSDLRAEWQAHWRPTDWSVEDEMHDAEHSVEAIVYWLRHRHPAREIVPILVPGMSLLRLLSLADGAAEALAGVMSARGLALGSDVAIVISADAVHYGPDFGHCPFGEGGIDAYRAAVDADLDLLRTSIAGTVDSSRIAALYETFVDPQQPDRYRLTWCGRFSIPFGMALLDGLHRRLGNAMTRALPIAYATSVGLPQLSVRGDLGLTAPASLYHFVGHPAVAFTSA